MSTNEKMKEIERSIKARDALETCIIHARIDLNAKKHLIAALEYENNRILFLLAD